MVAVLDVAGRLAEGRGAVEDIQTYVWACRARGYQHPDLTLHGNQIREWYGLQDGLDLHALDADCAVLQRVARTAEELCGQVRGQSGELAGAWTGAGGSAAAEFLDRHCACAVDVADGLQAAAQACAALRDELWRAVDRQAAAVLEVDARTLRSLWLPAAQSVLGGGQVDDDTVAIVDDQLKPFVDNVIRGEWLPAMRAAAAEVGAAYRAALDVLGGYGPVRFEVPGYLGPRYEPAPVAAQAPAPASAPVPVPSAPAAVVPASAQAPALAPPPDPPATPMAPAPAPPTALPGVDAGAAPLSGLADSLGGLLGSPADVAGPGLGGGPPDLPELDPPELTEQEDEPVEPGEEDPEEEPEEPEEEPQNPAEPEEDLADPEEPEEDPADPVPEEEPAGEEPPAEPVPEPPAPSTGTPCEIAAEELPQAGQ